MGLFTRRRRTVNEPAHVLAWLPAWVFENQDDGPDWDLQTVANHEAGTPQPDYDSPGLPTDASVDELTEWVEQQLGYYVRLDPDEEYLESEDRGTGEWCPIYWVIPD
jgi:hypothetical protein